MRVIGLTGGTGSGKSIVSAILKEKGAFIIDADSIAHDIILKGKPAYNELIGFFGDSILGNNREIIRKKLGEIVFNEGKDKLNFLNECTHKYIYEEIKNWVEESEKNKISVVVIDAPLLLEGNFKNLCNEIWAIYANEDVRLKRIMERDSIDKEHALNRINAQRTWNNYKKWADIIINNSEDIESVKAQVDAYYIV